MSGKSISLSIVTKKQWAETSAVIGLVLALLAPGLTMIGVTVNLWLGAFFLLAAFVLLAFWFVNWERAAPWGGGLRASCIWLLGIAFFIPVGFQMRTQYLKDRPSRAVATTAVSTLQSVLVPQAVPHEAAHSRQPQHFVTKHDIPAAPNNDPSPQPQAPQPGVTQTITNSPGAMQAGHDLTVLGNLPQAGRVVDPEAVKAAVALLKQAPTGSMIFLITFPTRTQPYGEISTFTGELERVFREGGWYVYRDNFFQIANVNIMTENSVSHGEGIGCSLPIEPTPGSVLAEKALSILGYPCAHPAIVTATDVERANAKPMYALFVSVGSRIEPER